jgi:hypothetical protein
MKSPPPGWMKASVQCLISIRHTCSLTSKPLLKDNCNSCPYCSDLNLLRYVPFLLTTVMQFIACKNIFWPFAVLSKSRKANGFGKLASLELVSASASLMLVLVFEYSFIRSFTCAGHNPALD